MKATRNTDVIRLWVEPATRESNDALYPKVASGDEAARDLMIQQNIGLAIHRVDMFIFVLPQYGHLRDDLISAAFLGLTEAVNKMARNGFVSGANPTGYIGKSVHRAIGAAAEAEEPIRVSRRTRKRMEAKGETLFIPVQQNDLDMGSASGGQSVSGNETTNRNLIDDPRRMQDIRDMIDACCEDDFDREIIRLREEGYVDREIAEKLSIPLTTAYVMRRTIYARFLEITGWKGEA